MESDLNLKRKNLISEYIRKGRPKELRNEIILEYVPLVRLICGRLSIYVSGVLERADLEQYGIFGLIDAIDKFNPEKETSFETYAYRRIKGEIIDSVRNLDIMSRVMRQKESEIKKAESKLRNAGSYSKENLACELGITEERLDKWETEIEMFSLLCPLPDENNGAGNVPISSYGNPENIVEEESKKILIERLNEGLQKLPERWRRIIELFYYEEMTQYEVAEIMEISPSRVSQIIKSAISVLRESLGEYEYLFRE